MRYTTILLDMDGTLFDFKAAEAEALAATFRAHGHDFSETAQKLYHKINDQLWLDFENGKIEQKTITTQRFTRLFEQLGIAEDGTAFNHAYLTELGNHGPLLPGAYDFCKALHSQGCRLYFATNGFAYTQRGRIECSGLAPFFQGVFISEEIGAQKPLPAYFDAVKVGIHPYQKEHVLMVGDTPPSDIRGGSLAGFDTCFFNPKGKATPPDIVPTYTVTGYRELYDIIIED